MMIVSTEHVCTVCVYHNNIWPVKSAMLKLQQSVHLIIGNPQQSKGPVTFKFFLFIPEVQAC